MMNHAGKTVLFGMNMLAFLLLGAAGTASAEAYARKASWHDTLLEARQALRAEERQGERPVGAPDFGTDEFTITAWIRTTSGGTILSKAPEKGAWQEQGKSLFVRDGHLCYDIGWVGCVTSKAAVADGQWHHVVLVGSPRQQQLYVDGRPDAEGKLEAKPDVRGHLLKIGYTSENFPAPSAFEGDLDELRLYARKLSAAEIPACMESPDRAPTKGLASYWPFDGADISACEWTDGKFGRALHRTRASAPLNMACDAAAEARDALWMRTWEDFPGPAARQEMAWEREDGIWADSGAPGNYSLLARRYYDAVRMDARVAAPSRGPMPKVNDADGLAAVRADYLRSRRDDLVRTVLGGINLDSLRRSIAHLKHQYGDRYSGDSLLQVIADIENSVGQIATPDLTPEALGPLRERLTGIQFAALVRDNPLVDFDRIIFNRRHTFQSSHYYTDFIDGVERFEGGLCALFLADKKVTPLPIAEKPGVIGRYDLSFDGRSVVYDLKEKQGVGFRIHEAALDGKESRALTIPPPDEEERIRVYEKRNLESWAGKPVTYRHHTDDMHPCYLPDGGFCFVSTRCEYGILCDGPDFFTTSVLYRMDADGGRMQKLTNSSVSESVPSVMNDGRILYTRWEYVDKGAVSVKCLWAVHPDGTGSVEVFGNDIDFPDTCNQGRAIPGSNSLFSYIGAPHMPLGVGPIIRIDTNHPIRTRQPMTYITPEVDVRQEWGYNHVRNGKWVADAVGPLYMDAYPLSDSFFLAAYNPDRPWNDPSAYGLYLVDAFGNRVELYRDPDMSCWQPMPLRARPVPPALPSSLPKDAPPTATMLMTDVYQGLTSVDRGAIKYLRVLEQVPRPWSARRFWDGDDYDQQHAVVSKDAALGLKVLHGVVPVEADGSAYFTVPADKNIYLEALDENYMEVQRMRTYVNCRPGESRSCIGCHQQRELAPPRSVPLALGHEPAAPQPQPGDTGPRPIDYPTDVQPILDRHCVRCHGESDPKANLNLTGTPTTFFNKSYEALLEHGQVQIIGENHPKTGNIAPVPPRTLGSHASKLIARLREGKCCDALTGEDFIKIATWVDANAQYYGSYFGRRNIKYQSFPDYRPVPDFTAASGVAPYGTPGPAVFIGGELRHRFIVTDHSGGGFGGFGAKVRIFSPTGQVEWEYPATGSVHEIWMLPSGNILFTSDGVREVTPDKRVVFEYKSDMYLTACQRLPDGNTLIGENPLNRVVEVNPQGAVVKTVQFTTTCEDKGRQFRLVRKLKNGNYLVAHEGEGMVREYDPDGRVLREIRTPGGPYVAVRLEDGNTLIACGAGKAVIEVDPAGQTVWSLQNGDLPGVELNWMSGLQRLPNGNTVLTCWFPCKDYKGPSTPQILEVTPGKKVVWTFSAPDLLGSPNNIQLLDPEYLALPEK
jgi:hypothetical protein